MTIGWLLALVLWSLHPKYPLAYRCLEGDAGFHRRYVDPTVDGCRDCPHAAASVPVQSLTVFKEVETVPGVRGLE
jgi:hypothetical protein